MARIDDRVVGHVGWARREIVVGTETVAIAGVGGVLIADEARGQRLGVDFMKLAARSMRDDEPVVDEPGQPILIRPIATSLELWPEGDIDLRGRAW